MKTTGCRIYQYCLPLKESLTLKGKALAERKGIILQIITADGHEGFGEIAPLPGFSKESFDEALDQTKKIKTFLLNEDIPKGIEKLDGTLSTWLNNLNLFPSVQFGIEMAALNLIANREGKPLHNLLFASTHDHIRVNGFLTGSLKEVVQQTKDCISDGFMYLKLKVGGDFDNDIEKVKAINEIIEGHAILHLDANRAWSIDEATRFGNHIGCAAIDYIEEPVNDLSKVTQFYYDTTIPVALDESLVDKTVKDVQSIDGVDVIVIKPTIIGGIEKTWLLILQARAQAIMVVISSAFESSLGILTLANLAGSTKRDRAAGLDTLKWFKKNTLKDSNLIKHGKIDISSIMLTSDKIDFTNLTEIV